MYQRLPSGPTVIPPGPSVDAVPPGSTNVVITPAGVMRPIRSLRKLVYQRLPSGPTVISDGQSVEAAPPGSAKVVIVPAAAAAGEAGAISSPSISPQKATSERKLRVDMVSSPPPAAV